MARRLARPEGLGLSSFWNKLSTRSQSNLYFALMFLDRERREAFRDVYRFVRAADDVADTPGEPDAVRAKLSAWKREIDAVYAGSATHPYARRLARVVKHYDLPQAEFDRLLAALEADVERTHMANMTELRAYCDAVAASTAVLCLQILGLADDPAAARYAKNVGVALQLANIVRDVREDAERGRVYLPADRLAAAGVAVADLGHGDATGPTATPPGVASVCRELAAEARRLIADARAGLSPHLANRLLVPEIWADVYLALLQSLEQSQFHVMGPSPYLRRRTKLRIAVRRWASRSPAVTLFRAPGLW